MSSAFPQPVDDLLPKVRAFAERLGEIPSRNKVMAEFRIGGPKAKAVLTALTETGFTAKPTEPTGPTGSGLHLVTDTEHDTTPAVGDDQPTSPVPASVTEMLTHLDGLVPNPDTRLPSAPPVTSGEVTAAEQVSADADPDTTRPAPVVRPARRTRRWALLPLAVGAMVAIWSGWVGLGEMTGFGIVHPLPGIADQFTLNSAITLPIGVEAYAAYAMRVWLARQSSPRAQRFARRSAIGSLLLGALGQVTYHLMSAAGITQAPWPITTFVACLPVVVLGFGAALAHLQHDEEVAR